MTENVVVTGAAGMVGSHFIRAVLMETNWTVTAVISLDHRGRVERLERAVDGLDASRVTVIPADLSKPLTTATASSMTSLGPTYIVDFASKSSVVESLADPVGFITNNVACTLTILEYARTLPDLKMLIHFSTDEVAGPMYNDRPFKEDDVHKPSSPYACSKSAQSQICFAYWRSFNLPIVETYGSNILGEDQLEEDKFLPMVMKKVGHGESVPIHVDMFGKPGTRYYQHARNAASALLFIMAHSPVNMYTPAQNVEQVPTRYNITSGDRVDNLTLAGMIAGAIGLPLKWHPVSFHASSHGAGHDPHYGLDGSRLRELGWVPPVSLAEGVARTVTYELAKQRELYKDERLVA
jgi:dTDP-glucose 4,6-dehydratase